MVDVAAITALVRAHGLDSLPTVSKDPLDVQARHFAGALRDYSRASAAAFKAAVDSRGPVDLSRIEGELYRYELASTLYAPRLIQALAGALLELENRDG